MGCRVSTELVVPSLKNNAARQDVTRLLPSTLTQGGFYKVAQPNIVHPSNPIVSNKGVLEVRQSPQNQSTVTEKPLESNHAPDKLPTNISHDLVQNYCHPFRSGSKDWTIVFVLGGPGCGKGTQCQRIVQDFGFLHLSAGDLIREEVRKGTAIGQDCEKLMKEGKLVPLEVTLALLENAMNSSSQTKFLIDGFPRAVDQAKAFEKKVGRPSKVIFLECPKSVMEGRLLKRGETSGRVDDTPATILKRFETFERESLPVAAHYESLDPEMILKVSSVPPPDLVYNVINQALKTIPALKMMA